MKNKGTIYLTTALKMLGISKAKFETLGLQPAETISNPHNLKRQSYLYNESEIYKLIGTERIAALKSRKRIRKDYSVEFSRKYPDKESALFGACKALDNLNSYASNPKCTILNKSEIYQIKKRLIKALYSDGYCISAEQREEDGNDNKNNLNAIKNTYVCFDFLVSNNIFIWNFPLFAIGFRIEYISKDIPNNATVFFTNTQTSSPLSKEKALIRWVLKNYFPGH